MNIRYIITGLGFIILMLFGFLLSRAGKPYNTITLNIHKLVSLAVLVYFIVIMVQVNKTTPLSSLEFALSGITIVFFVTLIATGGYMSAAKTFPEAIRIVHKIMPYLVVISTAASLYFFLAVTK